MLKVNLGCALSVAENWINIDGSPTVRLQKLFGIGYFFSAVVKPRFPRSVVYGDVTDSLPLATGSVDILYSSHMLEHLSLEDFRLALREIYRVLKPGGVFRAVIPDFEASIKDYLTNTSSSASIQFLQETLLGIEKRPKGIMANCRSLFGNSNHLWMWDYKGIEEELKSAGFSGISRAEFKDSKITDFAEVEDSERWERCLGFECSSPA
jgi:predicted SAM-dependent methyltransferase